jgi:hypothetical protein
LHQLLLLSPGGTSLQQDPPFGTAGKTGVTGVVPAASAAAAGGGAASELLVLQLLLCCMSKEFQVPT